MRVLQTVLPIAALIARAMSISQPQQATYKYDPTNATMFQLSGDPYMAFLLGAVMTTASAEGSSTGEVLRIATEIIPSDVSSWYPAFFWFAEQMHALAESIDPHVDPTGAREAYFHASTYYRQSVYMLVANASDPRIYNVWPKALADYAKAIALLQPAAGEPITLKAQNSSIGAFDIPAYFYKASTSNRKLPTVIAGTGYDAPQQDMYHLSCADILKRGLNCITYEGPGQPTPRIQQKKGFIPDWWSVVTPVVDYLHTRHDVDTNKIVLPGDSFGGLLAPLAASMEHRLSAMVLLDGFPNFRQSLIEQFPSELTALYNESKVAEYNEYVLAAVSNSSTPSDFRLIWDYTFWSMDETEPYAAWTRLGAFQWGPETAAQIGGLPVFVAKGQDDLSTTNEPELARQYLEDDRPNGKKLTYYHEFQTALGAGEHTSIGAEAQVYIAVMKWLSNVWGGYKFANVN